MAACTPASASPPAETKAANQVDISITSHGFQPAEIQARAGVTLHPVITRKTELWERSEALARSRYEVGNAPQSDILRAQLERTRLQQRRFALEAEERARLEALKKSRFRAPAPRR
jgi:hypothetical protein